MKRKFPWLPVCVHIGALAPLVWLGWDYATGQLTVNPLQAAILRTGKYALVCLGFSLACTPLRTLLGWNAVVRVRRALGLYAFGYASLHFALFCFDSGWLEGTGFDPGLVIDALLSKRYTVVGAIALTLLALLAATSFQWWIRKLGRGWRWLQRLVYLIGGLVVLHFLWLVKGDVREPLLYGAGLALLLLVRVPPLRRAVVALRQKLRLSLRPH